MCPPPPIGGGEDQRSPLLSATKAHWEPLGHPYSLRGANLPGVLWWGKSRGGGYRLPQKLLEERQTINLLNE